MIEFERNIDLNDDEILDFVQSDQRVYHEQLFVPNGFFDVGVKESNIPSELINFPLFQQADFELYQGTEPSMVNAADGLCEAQGDVNLLGVVSAQVPCFKVIGVHFQYFLLVADHLEQEKVELAKQLFSDYSYDNQHQDLNDFLQWINDNANGQLNENDFIIQIGFWLDKKQGDITGEDFSQQDALVKLYCGDENCELSMIGTPEDYGDDGWDAPYQCLSNQNYGLNYLGTRPPQTTYPNPNNPFTNDEYINNEVDAQNNAKDKIQAKIDEDYQNCGRMHVHHQRLLKIAGYPEFKVEWIPQRVRSGCVTIIISVPKLMTRTASIFLYVFAAHPYDLAVMIRNVVQSCAVSSAFKGAVVGLVLGNFAAAVKIFMKEFKQCVKNEIKDCFDAGIKTQKSHTDWS